MKRVRSTNVADDPAVKVPRSEVVNIRRKDVPEYLREGEFYKSLLDDDDEESGIMIPSAVLKPDKTIKSVNDLIYFLSSLRFWGIDDFSLDDIAPFIFNRRVAAKALSEDLFAEFFENFPRLKMLLTIKVIPNKNKLMTAIEMGSCEIVECLHKLRFPWPSLSDAGGVAASKGYLPILVYLKTTKDFVANLTGWKAAEGGHLDCLKFAKENDRLFTWDLIRQCIMGGSVDCIKYAESIGKEATVAHSEFAAMEGQVECLRYFMDSGCEIDFDLTDRAAYYGQLSCLQLLMERNYEVTHKTCSAAAKKGHLHILKHIYEHGGCPWTASTTTEASSHGHLDCLIYAHEHGCSWTEDAIEGAASGGHINCLIYAHNNGCPFDLRQLGSCCVYEANTGTACLEYLFSLGCPRRPFICESAAGSGNLACLKYAHEQGCRLTMAVSEAALESGSVDCLKYCHEHGVSWSRTACLQALESGSLECLLYAHSCGCALPPVEVSRQTLKFFAENYFGEFGDVTDQEWHDRMMELAFATGVSDREEYERRMALGQDSDYDYDSE